MTDLIKLTDYGEYLNRLDVMGNGRIKDSDELRICIGTHHICNGFVNLKNISTTHNVLYCRACGLRIVMSVHVKTYGDLVDWSKGVTNNAV